MKYKIGDKVRIMKPTSPHPGWMSNMNNMNAHIVILRFVHPENTEWWVIDGWNYHEKWLELVEDKTLSYDHAMEIV